MVTRGTRDEARSDGKQDVNASDDSMLRLAIPGGWTERDVALGERTLRMLLPADPYEFVNQLEADGAASLPPMRADPYWAQVWSAAPTLARAVCAANWPTTLRVLELGCGIGLPGLAACAAGCQVTFSDYVPEAVALALENARRNSLGERASGRTLDWHAPDRDHFDVVLACDVLYEERLHEPLLRTIERMLAPGGEAWVADPGRALAESFLASAARAGFQIRRFDDRSQPADQIVVGEFRRFVLRREARVFPRCT